MSVDNVVHTLEDVPLLSTCTKVQLMDLAKEMKRKRFRKGDDLMTEGSEGDSFFIIVKGSCDVLVSRGRGKLKNKEKTVATLRVGDYAGEQALLSANPRSATVRAKEEVVALVVNRHAFQALIASDFGITFAKRQAICAEDMNFDDAKEDELEEHDCTKSPIERKWIWYTVSSNVLFSAMKSLQKGAVIDKMYKKEVKNGEILIAEGDAGHLFYVIRKGKFEVTKGGQLLKLAMPGDCVGELALLYNAPRAATVKCLSDDSIVWCLHRRHLRQAVRNAANREIAQNHQFLRKVPLFSSLLTSEIAAIDDSLEEEIFTRNDVIIRQGEKGDKFYIIKSGKAQVNRKEDGEKVGMLSVGDYFGERALLRKERRAATIICHSTQITLLSMTREKFTLLLGNLEDLMKRNMEEYKRNLRLMKERRKRSSMERMSGLKFSDVDQLQVIGLLGRGGYGLVKLVKDPGNNRAFALKEVRKDKVLECGQERHINDERKVMMQMDSAFLVKLWRTYQDENKVYFLLDACLGGDLFTLLRKTQTFKEHVAMFYAGCVLLGFEHLHSMNMAFRDLKPENLVLDSNGYVKITDFGFCKVLDETGKTFTLCGTPDYLAPEIIYGRGHGIGVDYWTLGILIYEMLCAMPPFYDRDATNIYRKVVRSQPSFPGYVSKPAKELIRRLLKKRPTERLGVTAGGVDTIKKQPWFEGFDWEKLETQEMDTPYEPKVKGDTDISNFRCKKIKEKAFKKIQNQKAFEAF